MNSRSSSFAVVVAAISGAMLVGCDSVKDVREEPFTAVPTPVQVLGGSITGLGDSRPVELSYNGSPNCFSPDPTNPSIQLPANCRFYGVAGQEQVDFSFGSLQVGTPYAITVQTQPYGKNCTVTNGTGTVGSTAVAPMVTCADDLTAVPRYDLTVNIAPAVQTLPNLKVRVTTEEDVLEQDATGLASVVFPGVLFNTGTSLPLFGFKVRATTDTTADGVTTENLCTFAQSASFSAGGRNINAMWTQGFTNTKTDSIVVPTGPVAVTVNACQFTVSTTVQYHGAPAQAMPAGGMTLALRNHLTGVDEQTLDVNAFTATTPTFAPPVVSFPQPLMAHSKALYELVVTRHPTGMHCVVAGSTHVSADTTSGTAGLNNAIIAPTAGAVLLVDPDMPDWWAYSNRQVRCRAIPAPENRLVGTYQIDRREPNATYPNPGRGREFLTFFEDGTFLFGINFNAASLTAGFPNATFPASFPLRSNAFASSGVTHGFYAYNSTTGAITFTVFTATNINPAGRGISGMPGYTTANTWATDPQQATGSGWIQTLVTGTVTATGVTRASIGGLGTLSMTFSGTVAGQPTTRLWTMTEPEQIDGEITGTWVTADHRRMFAYHGGETFAFHIGVNGLGNLQDVCMLPTDVSTQSGGDITKRAGSASNDSFQYTCTPGAANRPVSIFAPYNTRTPDLPHYAPKNSTPSTLSGPTTPRVVPGFNGRFPGSGSQLDNRPNSPAKFQVTAGTPDTLTVQETLNGNPVGQPLVFTRHRAN